MSKVKSLTALFIFAVSTTGLYAQDTVDEQTTDQALVDLVSGNYLRAIPVLTKRANNGDAQAQYQLAYMYITGSGTEVNHNKGMTLFRAAADQGHRDAALQLRLLERRYNKTAIQ